MAMIEMELAIFTCDNILQDIKAKCREQIIIDKTQWSRGRAIEEVRNKGWIFDRVTEQTVCPACFESCKPPG